VAAAADATDASPPAPRFAYDLTDPLKDKVEKIARTVYGAKDIVFTPAAEREARRIEDLGYRDVPVCMAKTQLSLTDDPTIAGRPTDFTITVREVRLSAGAGFAVALTGDMMTMPGLPREPSALKIKLLPSGKIRGLMQNDD
jgi:formate--tetrahydrofolate ligase